MLFGSLSDHYNLRTCGDEGGGDGGGGSCSDYPVTGMTASVILMI